MLGLVNLQAIWNTRRKKALKQQNKYGTIIGGYNSADTVVVLGANGHLPRAAITCLRVPQHPQAYLKIVVLQKRNNSERYEHDDDAITDTTIFSQIRASNSVVVIVRSKRRHHD